MVQQWLLIAICLLFAYLLGSFSSAIVVCKLFRLPDPRTQGSGNPGTTNVLRLGGKKAAIITLLGDVLKGVIPVLIARALGLTDLYLGLVAIAAFIGHLFPVFFGFKGGKGVATAFGAVLALDWQVGLASLGVWILMAAIFRYSSLAALCAAVSMPIFAYFFAPSGIILPLAIMGLVIIIKHKANIVRLMQGQESKIGKKKTA